ncbi:DUF4282 domain-containing protein [Cronobacter sakazakii]|uniref:DUF4282 domain-containing protein n=1 Tax=Cronobacter sakazakii TaxID=28141 RepID=UPI002894FEFF|nr:DUF4282 domain-containing protein [Cronobacter sakazakii]MDT3544888.1 DUF4282 domain-containing protein [Cronobacter sakazakii]
MGFDKLITPKIISAMYIITMLVFIGAAAISISNGKIGSAILCVVIALFSRIFFECIMISFKNNEYLRRIAEAIEKKN